MQKRYDTNLDVNVVYGVTIRQNKNRYFGEAYVTRLQNERKAKNLRSRNETEKLQNRKT